MRAAVIGSDGTTHVETVDDPVPAAGELVLRVSSCGICGSDLKARSALPVHSVMGHEFCGEVVAVGAETEGWREGMRAAALPAFACGSCAWCAAGDVGHCPTARWIGLGGSAGGFAEFVRVSAVHTFELPDELPDTAGALVEPFAVGLHTVRLADIGDDDDILVLGGGPVGLTVASWARVHGARTVTVVEPSPARRALSAALGATNALDPNEDEITGAYDVVFECVGKPGMLDRCTAAARPKGRVVVAGVCAEPDPFLPVVALLKEVSIRFSVYYRPEEFDRVIDAFTTGRIDPTPLVTRALGLDDLDAAFVALTTSPDDGKILIDPRLTTSALCPKASRPTT